MKLKLLLLLIVISGCSSARLVNSYKNPEKTPLTPQKVLVVGINPDMEARQAFEYGFQKTFRENGFEIVPSSNYFPSDLFLRKLTLEEVSQLEEQLIADNFNAVILARVISVENKENVLDYVTNLDRYYKSFKIDYYENQPINQMTEKTAGTRIFHTETGIYHISEGKDRDLIWRGRIDIVNPEKTETSVRHYLKRLAATLKKENVFN